NVLAETELVVERGEHWVRWDVAIAPDALRRRDSGGQYVRLDLDATPGVEWRRAGRVMPGAVAAFEMSPGRMRRFGDGVTMSHRVEPAQRAYPPSSVIHGAARPHTATNAWRSDPGHPFDQWLQLEWIAPREIQ